MKLKIHSMKMIADYKINFKKSTSHERQRKSEKRGEWGWGGGEYDDAVITC